MDFLDLSDHVWSTPANAVITAVSCREVEQSDNSVVSHTFSVFDRSDVAGAPSNPDLSQIESLRRNNDVPVTILITEQVQNGWSTEGFLLVQSQCNVRAKVRENINKSCNNVDSGFVYVLVVP